MSEFEYKVKTYVIKSWDELEEMRADVEKMFNDGWKPTTNGPSLALPGDKHMYPAVLDVPENRRAQAISIAPDPGTVEVTTWVLMYVYAKERPHPHD